MTTEQEAKEQLGRVFDVYPTFRAELMRTGSGEETRDSWAVMLVSCDREDLVEVVDEIVRGDREPYGRYEKWDVLPRLIKAEANRRRSVRNDRERQQINFHNACKTLRSDDSKLGLYWRVALQLGAGVRQRRITRDECAEMMRALSKWYLGKEEVYPEWVDQEFAGRQPGCVA